MIIKPEDAAEVERARNHARSSARRARAAELNPAFVGRAYIAEAMKMFFDCDNERAYALASGLMVLAFADERSETKDGIAIADYVLTRSVNNPEVVDKFRRLAGFVKAVNDNASPRQMVSDTCSGS